jgi:hypothetical protein
MPGTTPVQGVLGEFDALRAGSDSPNPAYITFAGGGETLTFTHTVSSAANYHIELDLSTVSQSLTTTENNYDLSVFFVDFNWNWNKEKETSELLSEIGTKEDENTLVSTVSWTVGDEVRFRSPPLPFSCVWMGGGLVGV